MNNMNIDELVEINANIQNGELIIYFKVKHTEITNLRILQTIETVKNVLNELRNEKISSFYFVFDICSMIIPSNFSLLKEVTDIFESYESLIHEKLVFSIIQSNTNIFKLFFNLFKTYYVPIKPLYLCKSIDEVNECLFEEAKRAKYPNICSLIS